MLSIRQIGVLGRTYRNLIRYRQILSVLFRYGFDDIVDKLKIDQYLEIGVQLITRTRRENIEKLSRAERLRLMVEELGPTFVKFAQILSTRPDILPADVIAEFEKLQDEVPPYPYAQAREIIESELGDRVENLFSSMEEVPLASASVAQVHKAVLPDGDIAAVKVQRPGIKKTMEVDLEIMLHLATLLEKNIEEAAVQKPTRVVEEFARTLERELDFTIEAANMERVAAQFVNDRTIYIPKVYSEYSGSRVLTMEFIDGIKVSELEKLRDAGLDLKIITARGADFVMKQVFEFGFFHADPHPGNIFVLPGNVICPIDFGMTGSVDERQRALFVDIMESFAKKDAKRCTRLLMELGEFDQEPDIRLLEREVEDFMGRHLFKPLKDMDVGRLLQDLLNIATQNRIRIPPVIYLMIKAFTAVEGTARLLDPEFDMIAYAEPFVRKAKLARYAPEKIARTVLTALADSIDVLQSLPHEALNLVRLIRQNKLTVNMDMKDLGTLLRDLNQAGNRLSFSIIVAALILSSALLLAFHTPPLVYGISLVGMLVFCAAAVLGIWLLIAVLRKGML
jgi:ubiquinone biosynthesis protein